MNSKDNNLKFNFDFIGHKKIFFIFSACLIAVILLCTAIFGVKLNINFRGGSIVSYSYANEAEFEDLETVVEDAIGKDVTVSTKQSFGDNPNQLDITIANKESLSADEQVALEAAVAEKYADALSLLSVTNVQPTIGAEFLGKSMMAVLYASTLLIVYVALRFKKISGWSAGITSIIALFHDLIVVFGVFVIFRIELDYNFIAVLLTILGYSVNDTIIIYDRARENKRHYGNKMSNKELFNLSINQCLSRSINTSLTTIMSMLVVCLVAYFVNVQSIISFAFPIIMGMISGVYSTVCLAGPLWVTWQDYKAKRRSKRPNKG